VPSLVELVETRSVVSTSSTDEEVSTSSISDAWGFLEAR